MIAHVPADDGWDSGEGGGGRGRFFSLVVKSRTT